MPTYDIVKAWNNQDENDDQQNIYDAFLDEVCEDIATMALSQEESTYAHNRGIETIATNADAKETVEVELERRVGIGGESIKEGEDEYHECQDEYENCEDNIEHLLDGMYADEIID